MHDIFSLGQKSEPATREDIQIGRDLQDTLKAHRAECVARNSADGRHKSVSMRWII